MRLGQLARKIDVKPTEIVSFLLKKHEIVVENNLNSKIEDKILDMVMNEFQTNEPKLADKKKITNSEDTITKEEEIEKTSSIIEEIVEPVVEVAEPIIEVVEPIVKIIEKPVEIIKNEQSIDDNKIDLPNTTKEKLIAFDEDGEEIELTVIDGVIKAPKKEIEGFKVIGKIDLPVKKRSIIFLISNNGVEKDITEDIDELRKTLAKQKKERYLESKKKRQERKKSKRGSGRRSLSDLDIKERENKLAVEKRIQASKAKKEQKKKYYKENIQAKISTEKKVKNKKIQKSGDIKTVKTYDKEPTSRLGRIWKWFNT